MIVEMLIVAAHPQADLEQTVLGMVGEERHHAELTRVEGVGRGVLRVETHLQGVARRRQIGRELAVVVEGIVGFGILATELFEAVVQAAVLRIVVLIE